MSFKLLISIISHKPVENLVLERLWTPNVSSSTLPQLQCQVVKRRKRPVK